MLDGSFPLFIQGNSNKFSTVDMAAGYVGLSGHSHILSTTMILLYTYAGPLFWQLSFYFRYVLNYGVSERAVGSKTRRSHVRNSVVAFSLGLLTTATTASAVVCLFFHSHLFIWSVFAPKLFFMAAFCCVSIPFYIFMLAF